MCYLMKKLYYILSIFLIAAISFCVHAADDTSDTATTVNSRMIWGVSGLYNDSVGKPLCVNDTLAIYVKNHNTYKPLGSAFVRVFYGMDMVSAVYTEYTGVVYFLPNKTGVYKVYIQKLKYQDIRGTFNVTECTTTSTTSTTQATTTTTTFADTTTIVAEPETTTTIKEVTTTTISKEAVSDTSEPTFPECSACKASQDQRAILYPVIIVMTIAVLGLSLLTDKKKRDKKKAQAAAKTGESNANEAESVSHKKHKSLHHRLGLKKDKETKGETKK